MMWIYSQASPTHFLYDHPDETTVLQPHGEQLIQMGNVCTMYMYTSLLYYDTCTVKPLMMKSPLLGNFDRKTKFNVFNGRTILMYMYTITI